MGPLGGPGGPPRIPAGQPLIPASQQGVTAGQRKPCIIGASGRSDSCQYPPSSGRISPGAARFLCVRVRSLTFP